jgi:hypothetical protein
MIGTRFAAVNTMILNFETVIHASLEKGRSAMPGVSAIPGRALWAEPAWDARFCFVMECGKLCLCPQPEFQCPSELQ